MTIYNSYMLSSEYAWAVAMLPRPDESTIAIAPPEDGPGHWVGAPCAALGGLFALVLILPFGRQFYALAVPGPLAWVAVVGGSVLAIGGLILTDNRFIPGWALHRWGDVFATGEAE